MLAALIFLFLQVDDSFNERFFKAGTVTKSEWTPATLDYRKNPKQGAMGNMLGGYKGGFVVHEKIDDKTVLLRYSIAFTVHQFYLVGVDATKLKYGWNDLAAGFGVVGPPMTTKHGEFLTIRIVSPEKIALAMDYVRSRVAPVRTWTSADGRTVRAKLLQFNEEKQTALFEKLDGKRVTISTKRLCLSDRARAANLRLIKTEVQK